MLGGDFWGIILGQNLRRFIYKFATALLFLEFYLQKWHCILFFKKNFTISNGLLIILTDFSHF